MFYYSSRRSDFPAYTHQLISENFEIFLGVFLEGAKIVILAVVRHLFAAGLGYYSPIEMFRNPISLVFFRFLVIGNLYA